MLSWLAKLHIPEFPSLCDFVRVGHTVILVEDLKADINQQSFVVSYIVASPLAH